MLMKRTLIAGLALLVATLSANNYAVSQDTIYDAAPNVDIGAFVDQQFGDFPDFSTYIVGHVPLDNAYDIYTVTTYFTNLNNLWPQGTIQAVLNVLPQDGSLPPNDYDPSQGILIDAELAASGNGLSLTADVTGLQLSLGPGDYWFGLTPILDFGTAGQEFHQGSDLQGKNSAGRNPLGGFGVGTDWFEAGPVFGGLDQWTAALTVTGKKKVIPEPATAGLLALGCVGLVIRRRR